MPKDLHELPHLADSISYLYIERAVIEQDDMSIAAFRKNEKIPIPVAALTVLFLGPGTSVTHAAVKTIAENGCMVIWCGEGAGRFYATGMGETRSAKNLLAQARLCMDEESHMAVVRRMYERRFSEIDCKEKTLQQIRGIEGIRVRQAYAFWSKSTGVKWTARDYKTTSWDDADPINRAISTANVVLYGICHSAIGSLGYSPGLGFIHTGKQLSFVYDIADLYKADTTIPAAFSVVAKGQDDLERAVRTEARQFIRQHRVMKRLAADIDWIFDVSGDTEKNAEGAGNLWDSAVEAVAGGRNYADRNERNATVWGDESDVGNDAVGLAENNDCEDGEF